MVRCQSAMMIKRILPCLMTWLIALSARAEEVALRPGVLPTAWQSPHVRCPSDPEFFVHWYNPDFAILRQSACVNFEKPFLYLIFGQEKAILFDTGASSEAKVAQEVQKAIDLWLTKKHKKTLTLIVSHLHSHTDHIAGDPQFKGRPNTVLVEPDLNAVKKFFRLHQWPTKVGSYDLGGRILDILPIPGHDESSIAVYDRETGVFLTGDSLYPGRLYVNTSVAEYLASAQRMVEFTKTRRVTHVLGTHIENTKTPFVDYPIHTKVQPDEHVLELGRAHILELESTLESIKGPYTRVSVRDFSICGKYPAC